MNQKPKRITTVANHRSTEAKARPTPGRAQPFHRREMMTIKNTRYAERYAQQVMEMRAVLENLQEFVSTLPAPDECENIPGLHYGHLGTIDQIHTALTVASEHADEMFEGAK